MNHQTTSPVAAQTHRAPLSGKSIGNLVSFSAVLLTLCLAAATLAGNDPKSGGYSPFGKTLVQWQETWFRWAAGDLSVPTDANGNAVVNHVVLMPIPSAPGDGTPTSLDVTLAAGQPFVLPLFFLFGNSYRDGSPDDALVSINDFRNGQIRLKLDGVTILDSDNAVQFYAQTVFPEPIPITDPASPFSAYIWIQSLSLVHNPLSVGSHTITLDESFTFPEYSFTAEYHDTWRVTVKPGRN